MQSWIDSHWLSFNIMDLHDILHQHQQKPDGAHTEKLGSVRSQPVLFWMCKRRETTSETYVITKHQARNLLSGLRQHSYVHQNMQSQNIQTKPNGGTNQRRLHDYQICASLGMDFSLNKNQYNRMLWCLQFKKEL